MSGKRRCLDAKINLISPVILYKKYEHHPEKNKKKKHDIVTKYINYESKIQKADKILPAGIFEHGSNQSTHHWLHCDAKLQTPQTELEVL